MSGLNNKLIESKIQIEDYLRIREDSKNISILEEYNRIIDSMSKKIKSINLIKEGLGQIVKIEESSKSQIELKQLLNRLVEELKNENRDKFNFSYSIYISPIHKHISTIENDYNSSWKEYYSKNYRSSVNLLGTLNTILDDLEIIRIKNNISKFGDKWPINAKDLKELQVNSTKAYKKIRGLNLNDNIQLFLEKLLNNQMRLSDIDNEIYEWLKVNNLDSNIKLKI